ncbi:MAG: exodeoxyribonuclease V subunit beta [Proteobacteria bacterium]|nr:exodeoxyribonuclease V subunit beta [Pseudomonadota bacterium]
MNYFDLAESPLQGTNLIEASAGTGKTYTIAGLFLRLILEKELTVEEILVVTFTEAATEELRDRIRNLLKRSLRMLTHEHDCGVADGALKMITDRHRGSDRAISRLHCALRDFDESAIYTIHGFCQRMLRENAFESRALFDTELVTDQSELVQEIVDDFWRKQFYKASPLFIQYALEERYTPDYFMNILRNRSIDPSFVIVPRAAKPDIGAAEEQLLHRYEQLQAQWPSVRSEVERILFTSGLHRSKYSPDAIPGLAEEMDAYLRGGEPLQKGSGFVKFTDSYIAGAVTKKTQPPQHPFFALCEDFEQTYKTIIGAFDQYLLCMSAELFDFVTGELTGRKREQNIRSFDDLLEDMHRALRGKGREDLIRAIRNRFKAALIDEFQDTDPVQYDIFTTIFNTGSSILYLIGDPKQAIYRFRGADIFAYMKASSGVQDRYTLGTNWRSDPELITAVNTFFLRARNQFVFEEIEFHTMHPASKPHREELRFNGKSEPPLHIWFIDRRYADKKKGTRVLKPTAEGIISRTVAAEIARLITLGRKGHAVIDSRPLRPGDIAVLVRKNRQARMVQDELKQLLVPSVLYGAESIFVSHEAQEMERLLAAVAEPGNEPLVRAALATDLLGFSGNELHALREQEPAWEKRLMQFHQYHDRWAQHGFIRMFSTLMKQEGVRLRLIAYRDGDRRMTNLLHGAEVLHRAEIEHQYGMENLIKWLAEKRREKDVSEENQIRLETDENAVKLITIHRSKGLEYPVVFCPFAWDGSKIGTRLPFSFHNTDQDNNLTLDIGSHNEQHRKIAEREELAENVRLLYVAMTRAQHRCYVVWGAINESETSALAYLLHQPRHVSPDTAVVDELEGHVSGLSPEEMFEEVAKLETLTGTIRVRNLPVIQAEPYMSYAAAPEQLECRQFTGAIRRDWAIASYSSLVHAGRYEEPSDYDRADARVPRIASSPEKNSIFGFPRGLKAGRCIHDIFEHLDFRLDNPEAAQKLISDKLVQYGFDVIWLRVLWTWPAGFFPHRLTLSAPVLS